jgi:hypothetical protein
MVTPQRSAVAVASTKNNPPQIAILSEVHRALCDGRSRRTCISSHASYKFPRPATKP